jgi:hypothetical protein
MLTSPPFSGVQDASFFTRKSSKVFNNWLHQGLVKLSEHDRTLDYLRHVPQLLSDSALIEDYYKRYVALDGRDELHRAMHECAIDFSKEPPNIFDLHSQYRLDAMPNLFNAQKNLGLLSSLQEAWINYGFLIIPNALSEDLVQSYLQVREQCGSKDSFSNGSSFTDYQQIRDLFCNQALTQMLNLLTGGSIALYIVFAHSLKSTERPWHQDQYLVEDNIYGSSVSAWVALGDVVEAQGPFQFIPGSHRFGILDYSRVSNYLNPECLIGGDRGHLWTSYAHLLTTQAYSKLFLLDGVKSYSFTPNKGDVLISHPRLIHRAGLPLSSSTRPGIIGQWTTFNSPLATGNLSQDSPNCGWYWS